MKRKKVCSLVAILVSLDAGHLMRNTHGIVFLGGVPANIIEGSYQATDSSSHTYWKEESILTYRGGGEFRGGIFPRGKFRISTWCGIFPSFFEGRCGIFPVRNFVHVSHRTTVCLVLRRALPFVLFPLFCRCCQPTGKGGQEVE